MQQIFISYSHLDEAQAKKMYETLSKQGFSPWLDKISLLPGQTWEGEIKKALQKSNFVILLLSKNSLNKQGYFNKEIKRTLDDLETNHPGTIFLIPTRLDDCSVPISLETIQWIDMFPNWKEGFNRIRDSLFYQRAQDMLSKSIEELSPIPDNIKIKTPAKTLPMNIALLSGHWVGRWGGNMPSQLIVEEISKNTAKIIYSWGEPPSGRFRAGWKQYETGVSQLGEIEFGENAKFKFKIDKTTDRLHGIREASQYVDRIVMERKKVTK